MRKIMFMLAFFASTALTISLLAQEVVVRTNRTKSLQAQESTDNERKISLWGHVRDNITRVGINDAFITLMTSDSTVVDTMRVFGMGQWDGGNKYDVAYKFRVPARPERYIIRAEHPEYETLDIDFTIKRVARNTYFDAPIHLMKKKPTQEEMYRMLDEVTVRATKVKMVYKGDTIIYNADAFNLPEGSMLDALIRQLDGVELKDDGRILVNGQQIDELTLNGKDFFKHDKRVLLDNLPAYTVKNVMVHHKSTDYSEWLGRDDEKKLYVMDVVLKREYAQGWLANVEIAGGTPFGEQDVTGDRFDERYLARLFTLRYTDNSRLTVYSNTNNVDESRKPGSNGEWSPSNQSQGQQRSTLNTGIDLLIDEKDKRWKENATIDFSWNKTHNVTLTSTEQFFASSSSAYSRMMDNSLMHDMRFGLRNQFQLKKPFWMESEFRFGYSDNDGRGGMRYVNMLTNPEHYGSAKKMLDEVFSAALNTELQDAMVNRSRQNSLRDGSGTNTSVSVNTSHILATGDQIGLNLRGSLNNNRSYGYSRQTVDYYRTTQPQTLSNRYTHSPSNTSSLQIGPFYDITWLNGWSLRASYDYNRDYSHQTNDEYRLDRLPYWEDDTHHQFGSLPSTRDSLLLAFDANNSYDRRRTNQRHVIAFRPKYTKETEKQYRFVSMNIPFNFINERLDYRSNVVNTDIQQKKFTFTPSVNGYLYWDSYKKSVSFEYSLSMSLPDLYNMVDVKNDANPLTVRLGNPNLKMRTDHRMQVSFTRNWNEHNASFNFGGGLRFFLNQVSQGYSYNTQTGVYTYMPQNVDGNWQTYFWSYFGIQPDKEKRLTINNYIHGDYTRNVDYAMATNAMISEMPEVSTSLSHVNNWYLEDRLTLNYRYNDLYLGTQLYAQCRQANNREHTIETINAVDFSYGLNAGYVFNKESYPKWLQKVNVNTDIKMFSRRGYGEPSLNTDDLVWNASVSRSFCKGKLIANLEAFDILHQLSNTQIVINGQGRTETMRNTLPRYVMFHLTYKFAKMPKNREK